MTSKDDNNTSDLLVWFLTVTSLIFTFGSLFLLYLF